MKSKDSLTKLIIVIILLFLSMQFTQASQGTYVWTKKMGGTMNDESHNIATDPSGNIYVTGYFQDSVDFGADFGATDHKTSVGQEDIFVTRINANGTYGWTRRMGGISEDRSHSITTDPSGNVYVTGYFNGIVDFGTDFGASDIKNSAGKSDIFVTRINANGTYGWTRRMGGTLSEMGYGIATDPSGNIYVTGYFQDSVDFGADFGTTDTKTFLGTKDIFITRINANGTYGWTRRMGGTTIVYGDEGWGITTDPSGNIYVTGYFGETVDFGADFGTTDTKTSVGMMDIFFTRINANGTYGWTRRMGGTDLDYGIDITADPKGNVYLTGAFEGTVDFGADFGVTDTKTSAGSLGGATDIFVTRINANGGYGWTRRMGGETKADYGRSIATDLLGNVYVMGNFGETVDFGADFGTTDPKTTSGSFYICITRINANGGYGWTRILPGSSYSGDGITTDPSGNVYIAGDFFGTVNFGADFGAIDTKSSNGGKDVFVTKLIVHLPILDGHDFNGNGSSDASVWRPSTGRWYIKGVASSVWGQNGDIPSNGDYNGDGTTDIAVWRPSNGRWYIQGVAGSVWGQTGDIPLPGNYNGDVAGTTDIAVWRPTNGRWYIKGMAGGVWGQAGDIPVPGDYNGDGKTDMAVWRPSNGRWYIKGMAGTVWGQAGDIPVPGDYNGDGKTDMAVWRPSNGRWYIKGMAGYIWGTLGDIPLVR